MDTVERKLPTVLDIYNFVGTLDDKIHYAESFAISYPKVQTPTPPTYSGVPKYGKTSLPLKFIEYSRICDEIAVHNSRLGRIIMDFIRYYSDFDNVVLENMKNRYGISSVNMVFN